MNLLEYLDGVPGVLLDVLVDLVLADLLEEVERPLNVLPATIWAPLGKT